MSEPNSKATFKEYVKRKLGAPVLEINVDDDQLDDRIDEALQYFREYHYDGSMKCYLKHQITEAEKTTFLTNETHTETVAGTPGGSFTIPSKFISIPQPDKAVIGGYVTAKRTKKIEYDKKYLVSRKLQLICGRCPFFPGVRSKRVTSYRNSEQEIPGPVRV